MGIQRQRFYPKLHKKSRDSEYKQMQEDVLMEFVNRGIACKEELIDMDKKQLVRLLDAVAKDVGYWEFAEENKIFIN